MKDKDKPKHTLRLSHDPPIKAETYRGYHIYSQRLCPFAQPADREWFTPLAFRAVGEFVTEIEYYGSPGEAIAAARAWVDQQLDSRPQTEQAEVK